MASQNDSTTQVVYSIGSEERDITNMDLMTQHPEHTNQNTNVPSKTYIRTNYICIIINKGDGGV